MAGDFRWFLTLSHFEHVVSVVPSDDDSYAIVEMLWWLEVMSINPIEVVRYRNMSYIGVSNILVIIS